MSMIRYVDHTYRDFSRYVDDGGELTKHKKCDRNFPAKVHKMVSDERHSNVITWMPHGRAFKILDKDLLLSSVLPEYVVCKKYESFTRQLNGWGFKRLYQSGPDLGCYYHECFLRGLPDLTTLILRLAPNQGKATPYPAGEPNFWRISELYPLPPLNVDDSAEATTASRHDHLQPEVQHPSLPPNRPPQGSVSVLELPENISSHDQQKNPSGSAVASAKAKPPHEHSYEIQKKPFHSFRTTDQQSSPGFAERATEPHSSWPPYDSQSYYSQPQYHPTSSSALAVSAGNPHHHPYDGPTYMHRNDYNQNQQPSAYNRLPNAPLLSTNQSIANFERHNYYGSYDRHYPPQVPPPQYSYLTPHPPYYYPPPQHAQYHRLTDHAMVMDRRPQLEQSNYQASQINEIHSQPYTSNAGSGQPTLGQLKSPPDQLSRQETSDPIEPIPYDSGPVDEAGKSEDPPKKEG